MLEPRPVGDVDLRPELADAAGHEVGVAVQIVARFQGGEAALVLAGKAAQVLGHSLDDGLEDMADAPAVRRGQRLVSREALGQALEQGALGLEGLDAAGGGDDGGEPARGQAVELVAEGEQMGDPLLPADQAGVGDGVGRPGKEICQPQDGPDRSREDREGQVERAADALEKIARQIS